MSDNSVGGKGKPATDTNMTKELIMSNSTEILDKIRKLMALSQSPNENEAMVALNKARELMIEYKISQSEVDSHEIKNKNFVKRKLNTWCTKYNDPWLLDLCGVIARAHCCDYYITHQYGGKKLYMTIIGFEDDVNVAEMAFYYAMDTVYTSLRYKKKVWRGFYDQYGYTTKDYRELQDSYAKGFISGVRANYKKQAEENQEVGLILVTPKEVSDYMATITGTINMGAGRSINRNEWNSGYDDGSKFDTNRMTSGAKQIGSGN